MNPNTERALLLFDQSRHELAESELRLGLAEDPRDPFAHALLALCLAKRDQFADAAREAGEAIQLAPDSPFAHYAMASVCQDRHRSREALAAIQEALRLDPSEPNYYALLASIHLNDAHWQAALEAAEQGLRLDSEHIGCTNLRAHALVKLGRKAEAGLTIESALAKNPEDSLTHANQGWTLLEKGDPKKALEHFRESLRLDPENEWARQGIVEALKARNLIYAVMLRYFLWMSRLSSGAQWAIILAGYFGNRLLGQLSKTVPELAPWILPLRIVYLAFVLLTWTADPIFNLLLRLNRFGRLALSREQVVASNWVGGCLLAAVLSLLAGFIFGFKGPVLMAALVSGFLVLPLAGTFRCATGWPRSVMSLYTAAMAVAGIAAVMLRLILGAENGKGAVAGLMLVYFIGAIGSAWVANILISQRPKR